MHYYVKTYKDSAAVSDKYIHVNNFGYSADDSDICVRRENGRVDYQLIYVNKGGLIVYENGKKINVVAGSVCLFRPSEPQIYSALDDTTEFCWIHFSGTEAERMLAFFEKRAYLIGPLPEFSRYCHDVLTGFQANRKYTELFYEGELIALIARIGARVEADDKRNDEFVKIRPALMAIHSNRKDRMSNDALAELCGFSRYYFIKIFKSITGKTPQQYCISYIIDKGCYLLTSTAYSVAQISHLCGIEDSLYFSRLFKKHTGLSPLAYRSRYI